MIITKNNFMDFSNTHNPSSTTINSTKKKTKGGTVSETVPCYLSIKWSKASEKNFLESPRLISLVKWRQQHNVTKYSTHYVLLVLGEIVSRKIVNSVHSMHLIEMHTFLLTCMYRCNLVWTVHDLLSHLDSLFNVY